MIRFCSTACAVLMLGVAGPGAAQAQKSGAQTVKLPAKTVASAPLAQVDRSKRPVPGDIVDAAPAEDWAEIRPEDMLVMDLPPLRTVTGEKQRRVVIQLIPESITGGWVRNIKKLAAERWYDGTAIVRVQDNYVTQWGDPTEKKPLPEGLQTVPESDYVSPKLPARYLDWLMAIAMTRATQSIRGNDNDDPPAPMLDDPASGPSGKASFFYGWPVAIGSAQQGSVWPIHCYGSIGVGRNVSPDTGSGAELYTVIGHATRQLDRNIAVVGRVISGMEWLSSLPRGTGPLGFYEKPEERVPIRSIRMVTQMPEAERPRFEYLTTDSKSFADYVKLRANRHDSFYNVPAGGVDVCNVPVPIRPVKK